MSVGEVQEPKVRVASAKLPKIFFSLGFVEVVSKKN